MDDLNTLPWSAMEPAPGLPPEGAGDLQLLERILQQDPVVIDEKASLVGYTRHLAGRLSDWIEGVVGTFDLPPGVGDTLAWVIAVALLVALVAVVVPLVRAWLRARQPAPVVGQVRLEAAPPVAELVPEARYRACLDAGDARGALAMLWVVVARRLAARGLGSFGPEVTHGEFVSSVRADQPDFAGLEPLRQLALASDWLLYGGGILEPVHVRSLEPLVEAVDP